MSGGNKPAFQPVQAGPADTSPCWFLFLIFEDWVQIAVLSLTDQMMYVCTCIKYSLLVFVQLVVYMQRNNSGVFCNLSVPSIPQMCILTILQRNNRAFQPKIVMCDTSVCLFCFFWGVTLYENKVNSKRKKSKRKCCIKVAISFVTCKVPGM